MEVNIHVRISIHFDENIKHGEIALWTFVNYEND